MGGPQHTEPAVVRVLGPVVIQGPSGAATVRGRQPSSVAAYVALARRPVTRDELADLLWGEALSAHWASALRGVLSKVRASFVQAGFPATVLRSDDTVVHLDLADLNTDLDEIEHVLEQPHASSAELAAATAALRRPFLPHDDSDWGRRTRDRIARVAKMVSSRSVQAQRDAGQFDRAISELRVAIADDPLDESAYHLLIETLIGIDRRAEASEAFESLAASLDREFGIVPASATTELLQAANANQRARPQPPTRARTTTAIHPHSDEPFVGRHPELDALRRVWGEVTESGRPRLVIIEGPAGIGKTRLADQFCREHVHEVAHLMWGRNRDANDRVFGALSEAVQRLVDDEPDIIRQLGQRADGLWPLIPRLAAVDSSRSESSIREVLIESLRALLADLTSGPTVWFVDDLQWASPDVISIMESVVDGLRAPVMVIGTTRSVPAEVAAGLGSLQRVLPTTPIKLGTLSVDEVAELLSDRQLATSVQTRTGGLPFFASEIARHARLTGGEIDATTIPETIADWVSRRVHSMTSAEGALIRLASVLGQEVDFGILERCSSIESVDLASCVDALVASGLLTFDQNDALQFSHAITREVVYDGIGPAIRMRLHRQAADAIAEAHSQSGADTIHGVLAYHYGLAGPDAALQAWQHSMKAGRSAMRSGAWFSAASSYQQASDRATNQQQRVQALVGAGRAHLAQGALDDARVYLYDAVDLAEEHDLPTIQAAATIALVGRAGRGVSTDTNHTEQARLLRAALASIERVGAELTPRGVELWADLERELAVVLLLHGDADERNALFNRSLERARSIEPARPRAVARALLGVRYAKLDPALLASRIADVREVLDIPARIVGSEVRLSAFCYLHEDLVRQGEWGEAEHVLGQAERLADRYPHSYWTWAIQTWRALSLVRAGDLDRAEERARAAAAMQPGIAEATACLTVNLTNIRLHQGRAAEMVPTLTAAVATNPEIPAYRAVLALCAAESGDANLAADVLASFADVRFANLPEDTNRFLGLVALAHVAATVEDVGASRQLLALLEPYREQWVVLQCYGGGGATWGPTLHALARLATVVGSGNEATNLYQSARTAAARSPLASARIDRHWHADRVRITRTAS